MKNVIYYSVIDPSGETPETVAITEEINGFAAFKQEHDGTHLMRWFNSYERNDAIEFAVDIGRNQRNLLLKSRRPESN